MQTTRGYSLPKTPTPTLNRKPDRTIHPDRMRSDLHPDREQREEHAAGRAAMTEHPTQRSRQ